MHELLVTLVEHDHLQDLRLEVDDDLPVVALLRGLVPYTLRDPGTFTLKVTRTDRTLVPTGALRDHELFSGDLLTVIPWDEGWPEAAPAGTWCLRVIHGPLTGTAFELGPGRNVIGRQGNPGVTIDLADRTVSRVHAELLVGQDLTVRDLGSRNGTFLDGAAVGEHPVSVGTGSRVEVGDTILVVERSRVIVELEPGGDGDQRSDRLVVSPADLAAGGNVRYEQGALKLNVAPRVVEPEPRLEVTLERPPATPPRRRFPLASAVVPLVMGATMAFLFDNLVFLAFMVASPLMAIWTFVDDRRSGRRDFHQRRARYLAGLEHERERLSAAKDAALVWRHAGHPAAGTITAIAARQAPGVWTRRPNHPDFLDLRIGLADQSSFVTASAEAVGEGELADTARDLAASFVTDPAVPAVVPLRRVGVVGIAGPHLPATETGRWAVLQLAALQSERDVALLVLAPAYARDWEWAKWLPHTGRLIRPGRTVAVDDGDAAALFEGLRGLADRRAHDDDRRIGAAARRFSPHVVVVVQPPLRLSARDMALFVEQATNVGCSVVWIDEDRASLPRECGAIIDTSPDGQHAQIVFTDGGEVIQGVRRDHYSVQAALRTAKALAPLRDASGSGEGEELPARLDLVSLYPTAPDRASALVERWSQASALDLSAPVGVTADGPLRIDLRADGPHSLVAGTTGSGKSEFLQTLVAALAVEHPPTHLNFVLVDYKGGAAFKEAKDLPHTVGFVTDLDAHLTRRALISLNAELKRRERLLAEHGAKDLIDLIERRPDAAPPSLAIVIDEFAALKAEVPEFVDGVVDIGQRGRSLGVHLLLATQKPGGVVTAAIQANTNLRVALRVADDNESSEVIGRKDAADIDRSVPGRGYLRTGPNEIRAFQSAYVGGPSRRERPNDVAVRVSTFDPGIARVPALTEKAPTSTTDLEVIVRAAGDAARAMAVPPARQPWLPVLPTAIPWRAPEAPTDPGRGALAAVIGQVDLPEEQAQEPFCLDLDQLGHVIVYGGAGSGKTTLLRTLAASLASVRPPDDLHIYGIDFAGHGLAALVHLPQCGGVVDAEELDRLRRLLAQLEHAVERRRARFSTVGASSLPEYRRAGDDTLPDVLVLVDGFGEFRALAESVDRGQPLESFSRLVTAGRGVGLHVVVTADRRGAIPPNLMSAIAGRAVLPMANPDDLFTLGLPELAKNPPVDPGRAFFGDREVQVSVLADQDETGGHAQSTQLARLGDALRRRWGTGDVAGIRLLPDDVAAHDLPAPPLGSLQLPVALAEDTLEPVSLHLDADPVLLVAGPDRSGRTTALSTIASAFSVAWPDAPTAFIATRRNALLDAPLWLRTAMGIEAGGTLITELAEALEQRALNGGKGPVLVVVDDAEELADTPAAMALDRILRRARDAGAVVVIGISSFRAKGFAPWLQTLRNARHGILLQPQDDDGEIVHLRLPRRTGLRPPPGRGYLVHRGAARLVQMARDAAGEQPLQHEGPGPSLGPPDDGASTTKERER